MNDYIIIVILLLLQYRETNAVCASHISMHSKCNDKFSYINGYIYCFVQMGRDGSAVTYTGAHSQMQSIKWNCEKRIFNEKF